MTAASGSFEPHAACAAADGVRLCGGNRACPNLEPAACLGYGCTAALAIDTFEPSVASVCWADVPLIAARQCTGCPDGDACVQRYPDQLVCVSPAVCEALWDLGATEVCRYADKSRYDHQRLPIPPEDCCPVASKYVCGGACGQCEEGWEICTGRSPGHPLGICARKDLGADAFDVAGCVIDNGGIVLKPCEENEGLCAVFENRPEDMDAAKRYGVCLPNNVCIELAGSLPGGLLCFDKGGAQVAP